MLLEARLPIGYVVRKARRGVLWVLAIASLIELIVYFHGDYLPSIPIAVPAFLGTAISLLLSFKLSQSYDRWWEARKVWGAIVNDSRTLVRQALSFTEDVELVRRLAHRQIAWCYCLGQSLRNLDWKAGVVEHLSDAELAEAEQQQNRPVALLQLHARELTQLARAGQLTDYQRVAIDGTLTRLTDSMGMAERIRNTVFPKTYRIFLQATIYLFITLLSIALAEMRGTWQVGLTTIIAIPFLLLEKTARHMQDPFANRPTDISVTAIARTIDINLRDLIGEPVPEPWPADGFYLM
jgi:putative membrane protein